MSAVGPCKDLHVPVQSRVEATVKIGDECKGLWCQDLVGVGALKALESALEIQLLERSRGGISHRIRILGRSTTGRRSARRLAEYTWAQIKVFESREPR